MISLLILVLGSFFSVTYANIGAMKGANSFWLCKAYDQDHHQWMSKSPYQQVAINQAYDLCKKQSKQPSSCKTAKEYCENYFNGRPISPKWQCTAIDELAQSWKGDYYRTMEDAAVGARQLCKQQSGAADSCYVNLLTCKNLNISNAW